ncbi:hypothetical protein O181_118938 [Austropuccinia psidii MF-1]|uniref:Uncharacterized protein n=1 Tax=Austropuccinia psidii MF-1 TaxID=1389203 RepID=A0A9Q3KCX2_9BASI|nr:hypothetical protein [Austropuccinia psidii MF-1]
MSQTLGNSIEFNELQTSAPESGSEISDMPPSSEKPDFESYEKEKTVEPCAPTKDAGKDDVIFSGEVEIISKEQFVSNIAQAIPRLEKNENDSKIPDYVCQTIPEAMSFLKMDFNCVEVGESRVVIGDPGKGLGKRPNINATKKTNNKCCTFEAEKDSHDEC